MAKWIVRASMNFSSLVEAESEQSAIDSAPEFPSLGDEGWDSVDFGDYEAELVDEKLSVSFFPIDEEQHDRDKSMAK